MKKFIIFTLVVIVGLSGVASNTAFAQDLEQAAQKLFDDHRSIAQAYDAYFAKHGDYALNVAALVADGLLAAAPTPDCNFLQNCSAETRYEIAIWRDNDGNGVADTVLDIINGGNPNVDFCLSFNSKHTSLGSKVFRNPALGTGTSTSPWPENVKSFCVCWQDGCDVNPTVLTPGNFNILTRLPPY